MRMTTRLLLADIGTMWRQGIAISLLLACGIATWMMTTSTMRSMASSRERYYRDYHFADLFLQLTRAPDSLIDRLRNIPGVARVDTRIVRQVLLDLESMPEPASCLLVSVGETPETSLNGVCLRSGRFPEKHARLEVVASELFAEAHQLFPGDTLDVLLAGKKETFTLVGIGMSPEYVYAVQPGLIVPDNRRFGVLWMSRDAIATAFNMEGAFNDAVFALTPSASVYEVCFQVDRLTAPYGGRGAYDRSIQTSHARVSDEMHQMRTMAYVSPAIFLAVAAFLFNIVMSRMVHQQQEQIATLRSFGFLAWEIRRHYIRWMLFWVLIGATVGIGAGIPLSWWMGHLYGRFFRFPAITHEIAMLEALFAIGLATIAAFLGGATALRRATRLQPAVAMRPESPSYRGLFLDRWGLGGWIPPLGRLVIGRLQANLVSTGLTVLGVALGLAVVVMGSFMRDTIDFVIDHQYQQQQRQDLMLTFNDPLSAHALHDLQHLPGVQRVEAFRSVAVRLRAGSRQRQIGLLGLEEAPDLFRVLDDQQQPITLPDQAGLTITQKLAEILGVRAGDAIVVELLEGDRRTEEIMISSVFPNYTEPGAYWNRYALHRWLRETDQLSGAFLSVDPQQQSACFRELKQIPVVAAVLDNNAARDSFRRLVAESTQIMRWVNAMFAAIIAFGIVYNSALISLAERGRDLATLRVMGFSAREAYSVLWNEQALIVLMAIPIGLPLGYAFAYTATLALDTESHRFPLIIRNHTFAYATSLVLATALLASGLMRGMVDRLNLMAVLKVHE